MFTFREWWPSSPMGWLAFLVAAPLALVLFWALGELLGNLLGERFERASLWVSRDDFSLGRIVLGVVVIAAVLVLLIWLESFLGGPTRF
ncbi:MAG: hypothetical protein F9K16_12155 [Thermoanaerobaculia bacterium]|nr:MAG: hypothetical protein F9K16_12155 [Thermoanaerobaculia bacterium]